VKLLAGALAVSVALVVTAIALAVPTTTITFGPVGNSGLGTPSFEFSAEGADAFECALDGGPYSPCASPHTVGPLVAGPHTFAVRARDADGNVERVPATRKWTYVASPLSNVSIRLRRPAKGSMHLSQLTVISGTAVSASPVSRVQLALQTGKPDKTRFPPACNYYDVRTGAPIVRPCLLPAYRTVTGKRNWRYEVPAAVRRRLHPGRYTLIVRAFNAFQQATQKSYVLTLR
jgi:hypothetical protein